MGLGGTRRLIVPSSLGYGDQGAGSKILPGATLVFEITLKNIQ
jgi:FKBP-type peptidyl-prolyl cis-trans isomerase